ncbi:MAG: hypothetical protein Q8L48_15995 [Archangium sp.]|nr:hypothetical protein [Archangium sp.]
MNVAAYALCLALTQEPEPAPPAAEAPPAEAQGEPAAAPVAPAGPARPKGADDVTRLMSKLPSMKPEERVAALEALAKQYGQAESNPVLPTADIDLDKYLGLAPAEQAQVVARGFFLDLIAADTGKLLARSGYPFFMEARRVDRPEDLRTQFGKALRSRRADLLKLYSVEVFLPADMEKKYGKPPARLSAWNWRSPNTYVAVGNLSGHAAIVLLHQAGAAWQVVGFHD